VDKKVAVTLAAAFALPDLHYPLQCRQYSY